VFSTAEIFPEVVLRFLLILALLSALALVAALESVASKPSSVRWAVAGGGTGSDDADGIGADRRGRLVISGGFDGTTRLDSTHSLVSAGGTDIFAAGYSPRGRVRWARRFGGTGADQAFDNDADPHGSGFITGSFNNTVDFGTATLTSQGGDRPRYGDAFLLKLDPRGSTRWVRQIGGTGSDGGDEVAVGPRNHLFVIGDSDGDVRFTPSTVLRASGGRDSWAARYRPSGSLVWATLLGGSGEQQSHGISADPDSNTLVTGEFHGTAQLGSHRLVSDGARPDVFLAKLDRRGRVRWAERFGDGDREIGRGVDADARGNVYFSGEFAGTIRLGDTTLTSVGSDDMFLAKANRHGRVRWAIRLGAPGADIGPELEVAPDGSSYVTGTLTSASGTRSAFTANVSPRGKLIWMSKSTDSPFATLGELSLGPTSVNVLGRFAARVTLGRFKLTGAGETDFFVARLRR
jgi:hypothetical protein